MSPDDTRHTSVRWWCFSWEDGSNSLPKLWGTTEHLIRGCFILPTAVHEKGTFWFSILSFCFHSNSKEASNFILMRFAIAAKLNFYFIRIKVLKKELSKNKILFYISLKLDFCCITEFPLSCFQPYTCAIPIPTCPISFCPLCRSLPLIFLCLQVSIFCISAAFVLLNLCFR